MAKFKPYDYNQMIMLPVCLKDQILPGTFEHTVHTLVEEYMDMSVFDARYENDETGCYAYNPKILLKIILVGYARGLLSSRKLERACRENVIFIALTCGQTPDHSTIASFISSLEKEIVSIFRDILLVCDEQGLLEGTRFALDGVKLPSNASKEMSGTFEELRQKKQRLEERVHNLLEAHQANDLDEDHERAEAEEKARKLKQAIAKIERFLAENEPKPGTKRKENKSNVTDNDSHLMKTSHGVIQGYNAQAMVDAKHQVIVHADAGHSSQDDEHLPVMVEGAKQNLEAIGKDPQCLQEAELLADANYLSPTNLQKCQEEGLNAYIPDTQFRKREKKNKSQKSRFSNADFHYNAQNDTYTCPAGHTMTRSSDIKYKGQNYYRSYVASPEACADCPYRFRCLSKTTAKKRTLFVFYDQELARYSVEMLQKIDSEEGRELLSQRIGIIEPVFANIRVQKGMDRFLLRGKVKVNIQWMLYCLVHNIEKILNYGRDFALVYA
ncbi:MAG: IS1182 family transposase [Methanobacteriota archaeon]|nr:MAG: IS1182 family transposase [Euryarchaeota archaeon]